MWWWGQKLDSCWKVRFYPPLLWHVVKPNGQETQDILSLSDEHDSDKSLLMKMLFWLLNVLCSGGQSLSRIASIMFTFSLLLMWCTLGPCKQQLSLPACQVAHHPSSLWCLPGKTQHRKGHRQGGVSNLYYIEEQFYIALGWLGPITLTLLSKKPFSIGNEWDS